MNPNFIRSNIDRNAVRAEYLRNLQLETQNINTNYNANQIYKQTGALPPSITATIDTRSITDKYADIQKLRVAVLSELKSTITDSANANEILDQIKGNDLQFLANNLPQLIAEIKPKYALGITAGAFVDYFNRYKRNFTATQGNDATPIISSNQLLSNIQRTQNIILNTLPTNEQFNLLLELLTQTSQTPLRQSTIDRVIQARELSSMLSEDTSSDPRLLEKKQILVQQIMSNSQMSKVTQDLQVGISLRSPSLIQTAEQTINDQLGGLTPVSLEDFQTEDEEEALMNQALREQGGFSPSETTQSSGVSIGETQRRQQRLMEQIQGKRSPNTPSTITTKETQGSEEEEGMGGGRARKLYNPVGLVPPQNMEEFNSLPEVDKRIFLVYLTKNDREINKELDRSKITGKQIRNIIFESQSKRDKDSPNNVSNTNALEVIQKYFDSKGEPVTPKNEYDTYDNLIQAYYNQQKKDKTSGYVKLTSQSFLASKRPTGKGIKIVKGCGFRSTTLTTSTGKYKRPYPKIDQTQKVEKVPPYVQFGSHIIHKIKLGQGILQFRRPKGSVNNELPTQPISSKLKNVLITLTGTGNPTFDDINSLDEHEKNLLNKIVKHTKINDRLLVPTPNRSKEEQDYVRFQILAGELRSGNNNPTLIRELKTILLRLKNSGRIPKKHAHEILEDLLSLGY